MPIDKTLVLFMDKPTVAGFANGTVPATAEWTPNWTVPTLNNFRQNIRGDLDPEASPDLTAHDLRYRSDGESVQIVGLRLLARGLSPEARVPERLRLVTDAGPASTSRRAYFGPQDGWRETPVVARQTLAGRPFEGPLIIEEYDATTVIPPGWRAALDAGANIMIDRTR